MISLNKLKLVGEEDGLLLAFHLTLFTFGTDNKRGQGVNYTLSDMTFLHTWPSSCNASIMPNI